MVNFLQGLPLIGCEKNRDLRGKAKEAHWSILPRVRLSLDERKIGTMGGKAKDTDWSILPRVRLSLDARKIGSQAASCNHFQG